MGLRPPYVLMHSSKEEIMLDDPQDGRTHSLGSGHSGDFCVRGGEEETGRLLF